MENENDKRRHGIGYIIGMIAVAIVIGAIACYGTLMLWDYLVDIGIIPAGL